MPHLLVIDVGTSGLRVLVVDGEAHVVAERYEAMPPAQPFPGGVEFDADAIASRTLALADALLAEHGPVAAVGIANQRASTVVWDRTTGAPVGPGLGWQDLRTAGTCLMLGAQGLPTGPNQSATKLAHLLDTHDPDRARDLCFGTVDTWLAWRLTHGERHITDATNAALTGLVDTHPTAGVAWSPSRLDALRIPATALPEIVDSSGALGVCHALRGAPPLCGIAGDQQASLIGQGCVARGATKVTFGTGGMADTCTGADAPPTPTRGPHGTVPIIARRHGGEVVWGAEAVLLTAGSAVDWLCHDLGIVAAPGDTDALAATADPAGDVWFVPALLGHATPEWDFGARGTLLGVTRGTHRGDLARAVLDGVAHSAADLVDALAADTGCAIEVLRVDGGMTANTTFLQLLADATQREVAVSPVREATSLGAAFLAGMAVGVWSGPSDVAAAWRPARVIRPSDPSSSLAPTRRARWGEAKRRSLQWYPELSALQF